jgi:hypothetical protein
VYTGPSPRNLGLSVLLHGAAIAGLMNVSLPASAPPEARTADARSTEIRLNGKLYYVARIEGQNSAASSSAAAPSTASSRPGGIAAPRAAAAGRSPAPPQPSTDPAPTPAAAPEPVPEQVRQLRQRARAFIPPEVRPKPSATQTLIQPLSPPDLLPPPTPLPNFRVLTDVSQMRKIPKNFQAPGRRVVPTPAQAPNVTAPSLVLVPVAPAPVGDPLTILAINDRPAPFNDKVVVPPGNIAQPPLESAGPVGVSGNNPASNAGTSGAGRGADNPAAGSASNGAAPGNGRAAVGAGSGSALVGGSPEGNPVTAVGGNGAAPGTASPGSAGSGGATSGAGSSGSSGLAGSSGAGGRGVVGLGSGTGPGSRAGTGTGASTGTGTGAGATTPGSPTVNRPPSGRFDAVVVQSSPVDQYPESRGLLSGRPIYSVYIPMNSARDWTLFFCVPGEKPQSGNGPIVVLGPMGAPIMAPYPTKLVKPMITLPSYERYVLVHGLVNKEGKFESLRLVRSIKPETDQALLAALATWEFRAATRDGVAIAVEFLLSIPARGL